MDHFLITDLMAEAKSAEKTTQTTCFPLFTIKNQKIAMNINDKFIKVIEEKINLKFNPQVEYSEWINEFGYLDLIVYIYSILYSNKYRVKYKEFLRLDYPRIPIPINIQAMKELSKKGFNLLTLHLMKVNNNDTEDIVFYNDGNNQIKSISWKNDKIFINEKQFFSSVPENIMNFTIGGYPILLKWLKARKNLYLDQEDILHLKKIKKNNRKCSINCDASFENIAFKQRGTKSLD